MNEAPEANEPVVVYVNVGSVSFSFLVLLSAVTDITIGEAKATSPNLEVDGAVTELVVLAETVPG